MSQVTRREMLLAMMAFEASEADRQQNIRWALS